MNKIRTSLMLVACFLALVFLPTGCFATGKILNKQETHAKYQYNDMGQAQMLETNYVSEVGGRQSVLGGKYKLENFNYQRGTAPDGSVTGSVSFGQSSQDGSPSPEQLQGMFQMWQLLSGRGAALSPPPLSPAAAATALPWSASPADPGNDPFPVRATPPPAQPQATQTNGVPSPGVMPGEG